MQLSRTLIVLAFFGGAIASPALVSRETCSSGPVQCCNSVQPASSAAGSKALDGLVDAIVSGLNVPIGIDCTPINVLALGSGGNCNSQPVCCKSTSGTVGIGCVPVNAQL